MRCIYISLLIFEKLIISIMILLCMYPCKAIPWNEFDLNYDVVFDCIKYACKAISYKVSYAAHHPCLHLLKLQTLCTTYINYMCTVQEVGRMIYFSLHYITEYIQIYSD